jgi:hypothetical protein
LLKVTLAQYPAVQSLVIASVALTPSDDKASSLADVWSLSEGCESTRQAATRLASDIGAST